MYLQFKKSKRIVFKVNILSVFKKNPMLIKQFSVKLQGPIHSSVLATEYGKM